MKNGTKPQRFALTGAAGFIAPRHMCAIHETGNRLVAALDPNDSVGVIDGYFPEAHFFTEFERFDRHIDKLRRSGEAVDYVSICSPNYLHDAQVRFALRSNAHAICEKPLVLNPWNIDALSEIEKESDRRIYCILQLRLHPSIQGLKAKIAATPRNEIVDVELTYITSRGNWYFSSWKGANEKSGGIATNIGIHFFDMLTWLFGAQKESVVHLSRPDVVSGLLKLERARVRWFLSINADHLPAAARQVGKRTFRSILIEGEELEFSEGFTDLHTESYRNILSGGGFGVEDARPSIEMVREIREATPVGKGADLHQIANAVLAGRS